MTRHKLLKDIGFFLCAGGGDRRFVFGVSVLLRHRHQLYLGTALFQVNYWPKSLDLSNYKAVLTSKNFLYSIANSLIIATATVGFSLLLGSRPPMRWREAVPRARPFA